MALNKANFDPGASSKGSVPKIHRYSSSDALATIMASAYFSALADLITTGDLMYIYSSAAADGGGRMVRLINTANVITCANQGNNGKVYLPFFINQTDLLAPTSAELISPVIGRITMLKTIIQIAVTTGGTITAKVGGTAVDGLSITIADAATKGTVQTDTPTAAHASAVVAVGSRIEIVPDAPFATAGAINGYLEIETTT